MARPFDGWSARAKSLARPFAENPFRLLELEPGARELEIRRAAKELTGKLRQGRDAPRMFAVGPATRTPEQLEAAVVELSDPARAARHAIFVPWLRRLAVDGDALPAALDALATELRQRTHPVELIGHIAHLVLPGADDESEDAEASEVQGGRLFPGDVDLAEVLGPPPRPGSGPGGEEGFLATLGRAPFAVADAVLAATRLGKGRRLHASYLRTLLAQADGGDPSAWRRLPTIGQLFEEVAEEPGAPLVLGWRDFIEGRGAQARKRLTAAARDPALTPAERSRAQVLLARIALCRGEEAPWLALLEGPDADAVRGALAMHDGDFDRARELLDAAWDAPEARPRLAPLLALALLATDEVEAAARILDKHGGDPGPTATFARAFLAHAQGVLDDALEGYREVLELRRDHHGAHWGVAVLSDDADERGASRDALTHAAGGDPALARALVELALEDGATEELERALETLDDDDEGAKPLRIQVLDRLGRRGEAWALRNEREESVRDRARTLLEGGDSRGALTELAGLPLADPLRRRAARAAVLEALAGEPEAEPDQVVARVLGRVSPEEMALLDLPAHLYRAVRQLEAGDARGAVASLRRHLDSGEDRLASRLFDVLAAPVGDGWPALVRFLSTLLEVEEGDLELLVDVASESYDEVWEAAVVAAALGNAGFDVGEFEGGSEALRLGAGLLQLRHGLLVADWSLCAEALRSCKLSLSRTLEAVERAESAIAAARFGDSVVDDPELALRALIAAHDDPAARLHDLAIWRHVLAIGAEDALGPAQLAVVVESWCAARDAHALGHPALPQPEELLEDEVLTQLAALLGTVGPERAEAARAAIERIDHPFARALLARAGWVGGPERREA